MNRIILLLCISILFFSCKKSEDEVKMPDSVKDIFQEFCSQASSRGVKIKFKYLKEIVLQGDISQSQDPTSNGNDSGGYYDYSTKKIYIDTTGDDFRYSKESLIFHELGHALLRREHRNNLFADNHTQASIMHKTLMARLNAVTSVYYFDEMFNQSTPYPYSDTDKSWFLYLYQ